MNDDLDTKIKEVLRKLSTASQAYQERFIKPVLVPLSERHEVPTQDIFELALAQDNISLLEAEYELLLAEKYPQNFTEQAVKHLRDEKARLEARLESWGKREFPKPSSQTE